MKLRSDTDHIFFGQPCDLIPDKLPRELDIIRCITFIINSGKTIHEAYEMVLDKVEAIYEYASIKTKNRKTLHYQYIFVQKLFFPPPIAQKSE
ncbi:hypothetical protein Ciccas_008226 [Cichlidogyrus casuarinus]|uniref:Uncharacterized protein n=1 Tax=Cichlidogyrus casuarinus TaxID=1844966 RepID=A0ABD2Q1T7_9PLAT